MNSSFYNRVLSKGCKEVIEDFLDKVGKEVVKWVEDARTYIIGILPDGPFYAKPLKEWLMQNLCTEVGYLEIDRNELISLGQEINLRDEQNNIFDEDNFGGAKVLLVDNDIITGLTYRESMKYFKMNQNKLGIRDIKFCAYEDRIGVADFSLKGFGGITREESLVEKTWGKARARLVYERQIRNLTLEEVGRKAGLTKDSIWKAESVVDRFPRINTILKHCFALGIDPCSLFEATSKVEAITLLEVQDSLIKTAGLLLKLPWTRWIFSNKNRNQLLLYGEYPDKNALSGFVLDSLRSVSSQISRTKTWLILKKYITRPIEPTSQLAIMFFQNEFPEQETLAVQIGAIPNIKEVLAVTGDEDIACIIHYKSLSELEELINEVKKLQNLKQGELWHKVNLPRSP